MYVLHYSIKIYCSVWTIPSEVRYLLSTSFIHVYVCIKPLFAMINCRIHLTEGKLCRTLSNPLYSYNESVLSLSIVPQNIVSEVAIKLY